MGFRLVPKSDALCSLW